VQVIDWNLTGKTRLRNDLLYIYIYIYVDRDVKPYSLYQPPSTTIFDKFQQRGSDLGEGKDGWLAEC